MVRRGVSRPDNGKADSNSNFNSHIDSDSCGYTDGDGIGNSGDGGRFGLGDCLVVGCCRLRLGNEEICEADCWVKDGKSA